MFVRCCSLNCSSVFFSVFKIGSHLSCVANIVVRIFEIPRTVFVGHLSISVQIDLNCKYEEVLSNYEVIYVLCSSHVQCLLLSSLFGGKDYVSYHMQNQWLAPLP